MYQTLSILLLLTLGVKAAEFPFSTIATTNVLHLEDRVILQVTNRNSPTGFSTRQLSISNLLVLAGIATVPTNMFVLSQTGNSTNLSNRGPLTNVTGNLYLHAISGGSASNILAWGGDLQAYEFWEPSHAGGGELIIGSVGSISINPGNNALGNSVLQIGTSSATHELIMIQYDTPSPDGGSPFGYSKYFNLCNRYWTGSTVKDHHMGFRNEAIDNNGNAQMTIYSFIRGSAQSVDDPANISVGSMGTNEFGYKTVHATNVLGVGPAFLGGFSGFGTAPGLDVASSYVPTAIFGADITGSGTYSNRTSGTDKAAFLAFTAKVGGTPNMFAYYDTRGGNQVSGNVVMVGGGTASLGALDGVELYGGSVGTVRAATSSSGFSVGGGTAVRSILTATSVIDFGSTSAQSSTDSSNITVTGAAVGDPVSVGIMTSPNANTDYTAYVSAADTVKVRFNNYSSGAVDPASATFRVTVIHY